MLTLRKILLKSKTNTNTSTTAKINKNINNEHYLNIIMMRTVATHTLMIITLAHITVSNLVYSIIPNQSFTNKQNLAFC